MKGIAIGGDRLESVEFEGTIFVGDNGADNDWIGSVFSFQVFNLILPDSSTHVLSPGYLQFLPLHEFKGGI